MTALELNAELFRELSIIAKDEGLMKETVRYLKKLTASKRIDDSLITKEEMEKRINTAEEDFRKGRTYAMLPGENFAEFRKRIGK